MKNDDQDVFKRAAAAAVKTHPPLMVKATQSLSDFVNEKGVTMELESQLERTIVEGAEQRLREMKAAAPEAEKHPEDFEGPWRGTWPLVELAHVAESGLSNAAIQRLLAVEQEANALYRKVDNELSAK